MIRTNFASYHTDIKQIQGGGTSAGIEQAKDNEEGLTIYLIPDRIAVLNDVTRKMKKAEIEPNRILSIRDLQEINPAKTDMRSKIIVATSNYKYHDTLLELAAHRDHKNDYFKLGIWEEFDQDGPGYTQHGAKIPLKDMNRNQVTNCMDHVNCISATLLGAVISDMSFDTAGEIVVGPDYLSFEELTPVFIENEDLNKLLKGEVSKRLLPFFEAYHEEGILCTVDKYIENHGIIRKGLSNMGVESTIRNSENNLVQPWDAKGVYIGYDAFPRSVSVPHLAHMLLDFSETTTNSTALQRLRTLGYNKRRPNGNYLFVRREVYNTLVRAKEQEDMITPEILMKPPEERHAWFKEKMKPVHGRKSLPNKRNGWLEERKRAPLKVLELENVTNENIEFYSKHSKYLLVDKLGHTIGKSGTYKIGGGGTNYVAGAMNAISTNAITAGPNTRGINSNRVIVLPVNGSMPSKKTGNLYVQTQYMNVERDYWSQFYYDGNTLKIALCRAEDQPIETVTSQFNRKVKNIS